MRIHISDYRYHVGDKVLVRGDLHEVDWITPENKDKVYRMRSGECEGGWAKCGKEHLQFAGKIVTIAECHNGYHIEEAKDLWFVDDMFEDFASKDECVCSSLL